MNKSKLKSGGVVLLAALTVVTLLASGGSKDASPQANPIDVQVAKPLMQIVAGSRRYPAMLEAIDRAALHAQVTGYLESIEFEEGGLVKQGDVLFRIDSRVYQAKLADAQAALAMARAEAKLARAESERAQRLLKRNAISSEEVERRVAQAAISEARIQASESALIAAKLNLEFSHVRAPFDGRIGRADVTRGNLVTPQDQLAVIVATGKLHVRFDMDENEFVRFNPFAGGQDSWTVEFTTDSEGPALTGRVSIIDNEVRAETGTVRIRAEITNADERFIPGMYGQVNLIYGEEQALLVDDKAIGTRQGQRYVLIVDQHNALAYRPVVVGALYGDMRQIKTGLSVDEKIVVNGLMRVRPGLVVAPNEVSMMTVADSLLPSRSQSGS